MHFPHALEANVATPESVLDVLESPVPDVSEVLAPASCGRAAIEGGWVRSDPESLVPLLHATRQSANEKAYVCIFPSVAPVGHPGTFYERSRCRAMVSLSIKGRKSV